MQGLDTTPQALPKLLLVSTDQDRKLRPPQPPGVAARTGRICIATKFVGFSEPTVPAWNDLHTCNSSLAETTVCGWQGPHDIRRAKTCAAPKEPTEWISRDIPEPYVCVCGRLSVSALPSGNGHCGCLQSLAEFALGELQGPAKSQDSPRPIGDGADRFLKHAQA